MNIPGRDKSILSPAVPPALSACLSIKKTALLSLACNVCSRNRPTLLSTGQLPGVPFTCSSKRRSQSVTPYSCRSLQGKSPVLRLFLFEHNPSTSIFSLQGKIYSFFSVCQKNFQNIPQRPDLPSVLPAKYRVRRPHTDHRCSGNKENLS